MLKMLLSEIFGHSGSPSARTQSNIIHASLLLDCARAGKYELVRLLLSPEFEPNPKQASIDEALMKAAQNGHHDVALVLISQGTFVLTEAFYAGAENGHVELVRLLLPSKWHMSHINRKIALEKAATNGHHDVVMLLLSFGATRGAINDAFHLAAQNGHASLVRVFAAAVDEDGHDKIPDVRQRMALSAAADYGHYKVVVELLIAGCTTNALPDALETAAASGHVDILKLLLDKDADGEELDEAERGISMVKAASYGQSEVVFALMAAGTSEADQKKAIIEAARHAQSTMLSLLLSSLEPILSWTSWRRARLWQHATRPLWRLLSSNTKTRSSRPSWRRARMRTRDNARAIWEARTSRTSWRRSGISRRRCDDERERKSVTYYRVFLLLLLYSLKFVPQVRIRTRVIIMLHPLTG
jgi:ankyrin repeat protein